MWTLGLAFVWVTSKRLLLGWVTVCGQVNHLGIWPAPTLTQPSVTTEKLKSSISLPTWGLGSATSHQLCWVADNTVWSIWQVMLCSCEIPWRVIGTFYVYYKSNVLAGCCFTRAPSITYWWDFQYAFISRPPPVSIPFLFLW